MAYRNTGVANQCLIGTFGNFPSFTRAMASSQAVSGALFCPYVGTYTENFTMTPNITLSALPGSSANGQVTINGAITINQAGNYTISNIELGATSNYSIVISGSAAVNVVIDTCNLVSNGFTCINFSNSNAASVLTLINCTGDILTLGNSFISDTSPGTTYIMDCKFTNSIGSTAANTFSTGTKYIYSSNFNNPLTVSGNCVFASFYLVINTILQNTTSLNISTTISYTDFYGFYQSNQVSAVICTQPISGATYFTNTTVSASGSAVAISGTTTAFYIGVVNFTGTSSNTFAGSITRQPFSLTALGKVSVLTLAEFLSGSTLQIDSGATVQVQNGAVLNINAGANIDVPLTGLLMGNGVNNPVTAVAYNPSGFPWTTVTTATQTLATNHGYVTDHTNVTYTLPATANLGDTILIVGQLGITTIAQNAGQQILMSSGSSTVGVSGSVAGTNVGDCITLICITAGASTVYRSNNFVGSWTIT